MGIPHSSVVETTTYEGYAFFGVQLWIRFQTRGDNVPVTKDNCTQSTDLISCFLDNTVETLESPDSATFIQLSIFISLESF
jgi:hypothetical protein